MAGQSARMSMTGEDVLDLSSICLLSPLMHQHEVSSHGKLQEEACCCAPAPQLVGLPAVRLLAVQHLGGFNHYWLPASAAPASKQACCR